MKIIVFAPYYPPHLGGLENYIDQLNQRLSEKGAKITVFTPDIPKAAPREQKGAITVVRFPAFELIPNYPWPKFWRPGFLKKYFALHKKKYDLVMSHTRFFSTSLLALKFSKSKKIKWIHVEHGSDYSKLDTFWLDALAQIYDHTLGWLVLKAADKIVVVSDSACRFVKKISKRKSKVIYPGFDPTFIGSIKPAAFLPAPGKSKNNIARLNLIFIGRLIHGKGTADLIKAIDILRNQNIICRIIGEGPQKRQLKKLIAQKKLNKIIKLTGAKNHRQTIAFLKASDILINPSYTEGMPTTVIEAALCQKPVIATNVGGTTEIIQDKKSGLLFSPGDIHALAEKIKLLLQNPVLRKKISRQAYEENKEKFNWEKCLKEFQELFN